MSSRATSKLPDDPCPVKLANGVVIVPDDSLVRLDSRPKFFNYIEEIWHRRHFILAEAQSKAFNAGRDTYLGKLWIILAPLFQVSVYLVVFAFKPLFFNNLDDFLSRVNLEVSTAEFQIEDTLPIQMKWFNRNSKVTLVIFSAAITKRAATGVPVFSGWSATQHLAANILMISDPSLFLHKQLNLGWYAGNEYQTGLVETISSILQAFQRESKLILFGASGGGFAALTQVAKLNNAMAVVSNPQTNIERFSYYPDYVRLAWSGKTPLPIQTEVISVFKEPLQSQVIYIQNAEDFDHVTNHLNPFRKDCHPSNQVGYLTPCLSKGHIGPDSESFKEIFSIVCEDRHFDAVFAKLRQLRIYSTVTRSRDEKQCLEK